MASPTWLAALPLMPTNCSVEILAAISENPISHQVSPRPARKNCCALRSPCPRAALPQTHGHHRGNEQNENENIYQAHGRFLFAQRENK